MAAPRAHGTSLPAVGHRLLPQHSIAEVTNASVHSGSAWRVGTPKQVHAALDGRPLCPALLPFASMRTEIQRTVCCPSGHDKLLKDHGIGAEETHQQAHEANKLLLGRRILVVGDSLSVQWANALLVDLHGRGAMAGLDQLREHAWKEQDGRRRYCDATPQYVFNGTAAAPQAPILALFPVAPDLCLLPGLLCCNDGIETQMAALTRFMNRSPAHRRCQLRDPLARQASGRWDLFPRCGQAACGYGGVRCRAYPALKPALASVSRDPSAALSHLAA